LIIYIFNHNNSGIDRKKNHYTHARGKYRKSARLRRSFVGIFVGIFDNNLKIVNNISISGGRHLHQSYLY